MTWFQSQFDKLLISFFVLILCSMVFLQNDKLTAFAIATASNFTGCLLTLVTTRRAQAPDPTSSVTTTTSTTEAKTILPAPPTP